MANTIVGYFPSRATAEAAITRLEEAGFRSDQIGIAARSTRLATEEHGAAGFWDKIKNFFAGESTENDLDDRSVTPATYDSDDVQGSLRSLEVPDEQARYFHHHFGRGNEGAIVTVRADDKEQLAVSILEKSGGDVGKGAANYRYSEAEAAPAGEQDVQLFGEVLRVHKDRVSRGEVRLRKEVHTTNQSVQVPVTHEELVIERVPVAGEVAADRTAFAESEIRIPLSEERASVDKQAVVREKVRVGKKEVSSVESFDEQVRNEDLKVEENLKNKSA